MSLSHVIGGRGMVRRVMRPFIVVGLIFLLLAGLELSSALATEFLAAEEEELGRLLNAERAERGLPQLEVSDAIRTIARRHSQRMMAEGTIFHSTTYREEIEAVFPDWSAVGENVGVSPDVPSVHQAYMDSPGHRANILDDRWGWMGIGMVTGGGRMFNTQNFLDQFEGAAEPVRAQPESPLGGVRLAGADRYTTAVAIADFAFEDGSAGGAIVADGTDFHGALAGAALAGQLGGPVLLSPPFGGNQDLDDALDLLLSEGAEVVAVGVRGSRSRSPQIDGSYAEQAASIARRLDPVPTEAFVTTVANYPDALAASAVATIAGIPVLFTDPAALSPATADVIEQLGITQIHVLGGSVAVSDNVVAELSALGSVSRIAGENRFSTAVAVADFGRQRGLEVSNVIVATGRNFPDALAAGAVAGRLGAPILLTERDGVPAETQAWLRANAESIAEIYVTGGEAAVSEATQRALSAAIN